MMGTAQQQTSGVELTPKGIAYAEANIVPDENNVDPAHDFRYWRRDIEAEIERLIGILDEFDGDPDLEPTLGSAARMDGRAPGSQEGWAEGSTADGEAEDVCEDEGAYDGDTEPSLGAPEANLYPAGNWRSVSFGAPVFVHVQPVDSQASWARGWGDDDEHVNEDGGDVLDEPHDANTSDDCEPDPEPKYPNGSYLAGGGSGI